MMKSRATHRDETSMITRTPFATLVLACLMLTATGCLESERDALRTNPPPQSVQQPVQNSTDATAQRVSETNEQSTESKKRRLAADVVFQASIKNRGAATDLLLKDETKLCDGQAEIKLYNNFSFDIGASNVECLGFPVDVQSLLGAINTEPESDVVADPPSRVEADGKILRINRLGDFVFTPARPLLIGPVIQDFEDFRGYKTIDTYQVKRQSPDQDDRSDETASIGEILVEVLEVDRAYQSESGERPNFARTLTWQMEAIGFRNFPVLEPLLFSRMQFTWSQRPVMVARVEVDGQITDFVLGRKGGVLATVLKVGTATLLGEVTIVLEVASYTLVD